jgi:hemolysin activation/secretion protein
MLRYDNLWQKEHSIVMQYQTSPEDTNEVRLITGSYGLPSFLNDDHLIMLYALWSDSDTATVGDISVIGKGNIFGMRYMMPLTPLDSYFHDLILGIDYKDFDDEIDESTTIPVDYLPLYTSYSVAVPDDWGQTRFSLDLNFNLRRIGSSRSRFENKRQESSGNYLYVTADLQRDQKLPFGFHSWMQIDGQIASEPLISNEQFSAGGVSSVRGYKESEIFGDNGLHGSVELRAPDLGHLFKIGGWLECTPYLFYDIACVQFKDVLEGEDKSSTISGAGGGVRGYILRHLEYAVNWAVAQDDTPDTESGEHLVQFMVKFQF